jgi:hypothetical protein
LIPDNDSVGNVDGTARGCCCCSSLRDSCYHIVDSIVSTIKNVVDVLLQAIPVLPLRIAELNCSEVPLVSFVDERLEGRIHLGGHHFPCVEFLEWKNVQ